MKNKTLKIITAIMLMTLFIIISMPKSFAGISPGQITGEVPSGTQIDVSFVDKIADLIRIFGSFIAVGVLMIIGIKYMTGSIEEKANYKKSMMPYLIGCVLLFGASTIGANVIEIFKENENVEDVGNIILGIIQSIGTFVAVAMLMILGIKYMLGSLEERATYKKSMLPYVIGAVLLFGAVNITAIVVDTVQQEAGGQQTPEQGEKEANSYTSTHTEAEIQAEYQRARQEYLKASNAEKRNENTIQYWSKYMSTLDSYLSNN